MRYIVAKETDFEEWDTSCRAEQCCMIIYDLYFTVVDVGGELRLRVSLQENENAYLDFIIKNKEFEVVRRKDMYADKRMLNKKTDSTRIKKVLFSVYSTRIKYIFFYFIVIVLPFVVPFIISIIQNWIMSLKYII